MEQARALLPPLDVSLVAGPGLRGAGGEGRPGAEGWRTHAKLAAAPLGPYGGVQQHHTNELPTFPPLPCAPTPSSR